MNIFNILVKGVKGIWCSGRVDRVLFVIFLFVLFVVIHTISFGQFNYDRSWFILGC